MAVHFKVIAVILSIIGLVTFSLFILEESLQSIMFATWAAKDAKRWDLVLYGLDTSKKINRTIKIVNHLFGWIQPLSFLAYRSYAKATDIYIESATSEVLARQPELFVGREIELLFRPTKIKGELLCNGQICIEGNNWKEKSLGKFQKIRGSLINNNGNLILQP